MPSFHVKVNRDFVSLSHFFYAQNLSRSGVRKKIVHNRYPPFRKQLEIHKQALMIFDSFDECVFNSISTMLYSRQFTTFIKTPDNKRCVANIEHNIQNHSGMPTPTLKLYWDS